MKCEKCGKREAMVAHMDIQAEEPIFFLYCEECALFMVEDLDGTRG